MGLRLEDNSSSGECSSENLLSKHGLGLLSSGLQSQHQKQLTNHTDVPTGPSNTDTKQELTVQGLTGPKQGEETQDDKQCKLPRPVNNEACPRCSSTDTKFCYYNNYNIKQPRYFCKACQRYWTSGGTLRNVPPGSGRRKSKTLNEKNNLISDLTKQSGLFQLNANSLAYASGLNPLLADPLLTAAYGNAGAQQQLLNSNFSGLNKLSGISALQGQILAGLPADSFRLNQLGLGAAQLPAGTAVANGSLGAGLDARLLSGLNGIGAVSAVNAINGVSGLDASSNANCIADDGSVDGRRLRLKLDHTDGTATSITPISLSALAGANSAALATLVQPSQSIDLKQHSGTAAALAAANSLNSLTNAAGVHQLNRSYWIQQAQLQQLLPTANINGSLGAVNTVDINATLLQQNATLIQQANAQANIMAQQALAQQSAAVAAQQSAAAAVAAQQSAAATATLQQQGAAQVLQAQALSQAQAAALQSAAAGAGWQMGQVNPYYAVWPYNNTVSAVNAPNYAGYMATTATYTGGSPVSQVYNHAQHVHTSQLVPCMQHTRCAGEGIRCCA